MKFHWVSKPVKINKKTTESRIVGFVTSFGWETAKAKAKAKYPHLDEFELHTMKRRR